MATTMTEDQLDLVFSALADRTRRAILTRLEAHRERLGQLVHR